MRKNYRYLNIVALLICISFVAQLADAGKRRRRKKIKVSTEKIQKPVKKPPVKKDMVKSITPPVAKRIVKDTTPLFIPVSGWVGKKFVLLEKTKVFRKFGYELYVTPQLSKSSAPPDPKIALKSHRLKYEPFCKSIITATSVKKSGNGEYLVSFTMDKTNLLLYGKTKEGIIEGLAMVDDLQTAKKRWMGKTIYCRRRYVDVYDSVRSNFSSVKIPITEPMKVISVRWGVIPLPPKLLWLTVERGNGFQGVIPVNVSWTNVIRFEKQVELPWEYELFEKDPKKIYTWDRYVWESINKHNIFIGMTQQQVSFSWGEPKKKFVGKDDKGKDIVTYKYDGKTLTFENGVLVRSAE